MCTSPEYERDTQTHTHKHKGRQREGERAAAECWTKGFCCGHRRVFPLRRGPVGVFGPVSLSPFLHRQQIFLLIWDKCLRHSSGREAYLSGLWKVSLPDVLLPEMSFSCSSCSIHEENWTELMTQSRSISTQICWRVFLENVIFRFYLIFNSLLAALKRPLLWQCVSLSVGEIKLFLFVCLFSCSCSAKSQIISAGWRRQTSLLH